MNFVKIKKVNFIFAVLFVFQSILIYAGSKTITLRYKESDVTFSKQKGYDVVSLPEFDFIDDISKVGEPMMPVKTIRVLIPPGTEITHVKIISVKEKNWMGNITYIPFNIRFMGKRQRNLFRLKKKYILLLKIIQVN